MGDVEPGNQKGSGIPLFVLIAATAGMAGFLLRDKQIEKNEPAAVAVPPIASSAAPPSLEIVSPEIAESNRNLTLPELAAKVRPSVLQIISKNSDGKESGTGSGFIVGPGLLVTNRHVVRKASSAEAKSEDGTIYTIEGVIVWHLKNDLALLSIKGDGPPSLDLDDARVPDVGEDVAVIGSPLGLEGSLSNGIVSAIRKNEGATKSEYVQITAPISPGSSGSPVVDHRGRVIGVATLAAKHGQNLNFAVPSRHVREMLVQAEFAGEQVVPFKVAAQIPIKEEKSRLESDPNYLKSKQYWEERTWFLMEKSAENLDRKYPDTALAKLFLGVALTGLDEYEKAEAMLQTAVTIQPDFAEGWIHYGKALTSGGKHQEAMEAFVSALEIEENHPDAWSGIAETFLTLEMTQDALSAAEKSIEFQFGNYGARMVLGRIYTAEGEIEKACESYRIAMDMNPSSEMAGIALINLLCTHGKWSEAKAIVDQSRSTKSDSGSLLEEVFRIHLEARNAAFQAEPIEPESAPEKESEDEATKAVSFALEYLRRGDSDAPPGQGALFYSDPVDYFDQGVITLSKAIENETKYESRWPLRRHIPVQPPIFGESEAGRFDVQITSVFAISDNKRQFKRIDVTTGFLVSTRPMLEILSVRTVSSETRQLNKSQFKRLFDQIGKDKGIVTP